MPTQSPIQQYYHLQHESFFSHVKAVLEALEKILALKEDQVTEQQRAAVRGLKALYNSQVVEEIERDLVSGHVSMETVEKRVQLEENASRAVIELMNPSPIGKIFLELLIAEHMNAMRMKLGNLVLLMNNK